MHIRYLAAKIINDVTDGRSLTDSLDTCLPTIPDSRDRAFVQAVCYGVCRYYTQLDVILSELLQSPMKAKDSDVHALLMVGLFQLIYMRLPDYAAVTETVNATAKLNKPWSRGFVNAIMRSYQREHARIENAIADDEEALYAHPDWWIRLTKHAWPAVWQDILHENNEHPPFALRIDTVKTSRESYLQTLQDASIEAQIIPETKSGIILTVPVPVDELPGFAEGDVFVQDGAAQLCAGLLALEDGMHVLDACAAPGGKLTHLLESANNITAVAVEKDKQRMASIHDNLTRLHLQAQCICADAADTKSWWDGKQFDRILLDAPCSASGVVRRHPDIKLLRQKSDMTVLAREQVHLLAALWPLLKPGGILLYATCSIFPQENAEVVSHFLTKHADAREIKPQVEWGIAMEAGRQILPGMHKMDGFYYALLARRSGDDTASH